MPASVIAFVNFKGGVGKTANVVNIGACLGKYHAKKVLIVDLYPQSNSSLWLMQPEEWRKHTTDLKRSVYQVFHDRIFGTHLFDFEKALVWGVPRRDFPLIANLDLLPSAVDMVKIEDQIHQIKSLSVFTILYQALKPHLGPYQYVFLDCPLIYTPYPKMPCLLPIIASSPIFRISFLFPDLKS